MIEWIVSVSCTSAADIFFVASGFRHFGTMDCTRVSRTAAVSLSTVSALKACNVFRSPTEAEYAWIEINRLKRGYAVRSIVVNAPAPTTTARPEPTGPRRPDVTHAEES
ncbi:hypothetical protein [Embleya sp. NPDC005575]|uniref:hypothetical protein n=1 Tax=Embleya sp. NPDC005575 TaxID=3156892 RepID=UPI0033B2D65D